MSSGRSGASAELGSVLRNVLMRPATGFAAAFRAMDRRERMGRTPPEGWSPYIGSAVGGAGIMLTWLKVGALLGLRHSDGGHHLWSFLVLSLVVGAVVAEAALFLWSWVGRAPLGALGVDASPRELRTIGGLAGLPQLFSIALIFPVDLLVAGSASFTTEALADPVSQLWAALSVAVSVALAVWSVVIVIRGLQSLGDLRLMPAAATGALGVLCLVGLAFVLLAGTAALTRTF